MLLAMYITHKPMSIVYNGSLVHFTRTLSVEPLSDFRMTLVSVNFRHLFYQPMEEKIKTWTLRLPAKEISDMEKALFHWPIVLQYDVKAKYRLISGRFFGHEVSSTECSLNQPKATRVCICSTNQLNRSISVRLLFRSFQGHTKVALYWSVRVL